MARFLFAWELGDNYGHLTTFNSIAIELAGRGHDVHVAAQNLMEANSFFPKDTVRLLQSPAARSQFEPASTDLTSYAHVIEGFGFQHPEQLSQLVSAWRDVYAHIKPDVVVLNAPPAALLAARDRDFALALIGSGYDCPPRTTPMPCFLSEKGNKRGLVLQREQKVLGVINQAMQQLRLPTLEALRDIFTMDHEFLTTFKELDHFPSRTGGNYYGAQFSLKSGEEVAWPALRHGQGDKRIFVYVRPASQHFQPLLSALRDVPARAIVASPGIKDVDLRRFVAPNVRIRGGPIRLERIRPECDLAISAGGHGTIAAFLQGGVPLVLLPNHMEQLMAGRAAVATGAAIMPKIGKRVPIMQMIRDGLEQPRFRKCAQAFAKKYWDFQSENQTQRITAELEQSARR